MHPFFRIAFACLLTLALHCTASARPSITLIVADDVPATELAYMPRTMELAAEGVRFDGAFAPQALCAPSRVSILTGLYPSTHGVTTNPQGRRFPGEDTIATRLHGVGYATALVGKYMNRWKARFVPPGWDLFEHFLETHGRGQSDYIRERAVALMAGDGPSFLYLGPYAAHAPLYGPVRCDVTMRADMPAMWNQRRSALCGLDDLVADVVTNRGDSWVIFTADNGWMYSPRTGKKELNIDAANVPLVVWGPDVAPGVRRELVSLVDLAPTIMEIAGASAEGMEGQSFLSLLRGTDHGWFGRVVIEGRP